MKIGGDGLCESAGLAVFGFLVNRPGRGPDSIILPPPNPTATAQGNPNRYPGFYQELPRAHFSLIL